MLAKEKVKKIFEDPLGNRCRGYDDISEYNISLNETFQRLFRRKGFKYFWTY